MQGLIILPQALRITLPNIVNSFIALFKDTSVCSVISLVELTKQYSILANSTGGAIEFALAGQSNTIHRHRIEHASVTPPDCLERMAELQIVATLQPQFVTSDTWTAKRLGPARSRARGASSP